MAKQPPAYIRTVEIRRRSRREYCGRPCINSIVAPQGESGSF
jgi:hypothetical protein